MPTKDEIAKRIREKNTPTPPQEGEIVKGVRFFVFIAYADGLPLALRLKDEGYDVTLALLDPEERNEDYEPPEDEEEAEEEERLFCRCQTLADGMLPKMSAAEAMEYLLDHEDEKDSFYIIFDQIYGYPLADSLREKGYKVVGGSKWGYELEHDRSAGQKFIAAHGIRVAEQMKFKGSEIEKAKQYIEDSDCRLVLKSDNGDVSTFVPEKDNWRKELLGYISSKESDIAKDNFELTEFVDGYEVATEVWYYDGVPVLANIDFEDKRKYAENVPSQTGCAFDLVTVVGTDNPLIQIANAPFFDTMKKTKGAQILDLGFIYDPKEDEIVALEVCGNRFGYNAVYTMFQTLDPFVKMGQVFIDWMDGELDEEKTACYFNGWGASVRVYLEKAKKGKKITFDDVIAGKVWLWDVREEEGELRTAGYDDAIACITAHASSPWEATKKLKHSILPKFEPKELYRPDFDSESYSSMPLARYQWFKSNGFLDKDTSDHTHPLIDEDGVRRYR